TIGKNLVDIRVRVKDIAPDAGIKPFTIKNINIYPSYSLRRDSTLRKLDPLVYHDFNIYDDRNTFKPRVFDRLVFFKKDELYNRRDHNLSLNRMVNIGAFQNVKAEFLPLDSFKNDQLDLNIYLTPLRKNSLSFGVTGTSKSNNFVGSEVKLTQTKRNVFRGAEILELSASGGFETQVSGKSAQNLNSYSLTGEAKLTFPRFIVPFFKPSSTNAFIPKTIASVSYQLLNRGSLYTLNSFKGEYGYSFKENQFKEHIFNPISINYVQPSIKSRDTVALFDSIPGLQYTLQPQLIIGSNYNFTYTNQMDQSRRNNMYFNGSIETGGNLWGLFVPKNGEGKRSLFDVDLNQFVRLEADFRDYYKINRGVTWANRLNIGYGYA
ncbi:MAG: hypothetical protein EOO89_30815, partial [Pedobacter sp.]